MSGGAESPLDSGGRLVDFKELAKIRGRGNHDSVCIHTVDGVRQILHLSEASAQIVIQTVES